MKKRNKQSAYLRSKLMNIPMWPDPPELKVFESWYTRFLYSSDGTMITARNIVSPKRYRPVAEIRMVIQAWYLCNYPEMPYEQISAIFGRSDHSTAIHAINMVVSMLKIGEESICDKWNSLDSFVGNANRASLDGSAPNQNTRMCAVPNVPPLSDINFSMLRRSAGMSIMDVSNKTGIHIYYIKRIEDARFQDAKYEHVRLLMELYAECGR